MNTTTTIKIRDILCKSYEHVKMAQSEWNQFLSMAQENDFVDNVDDMKTSSNSLCLFMRIAMNYISMLDKLVDANIEMFANKSVLEAELRWGDTAKKIVVGKPNSVFRDPFISLSFFRAFKLRNGIVRDSEIVCNESFDVLVVDGKTICHTIKGDF